MSRKCEICGKRAMTGSSIARRGLAKKKGGVGLKTTGITKRKFFPNLQKKKAVINGKVKKILICTKCIKGGKLTPAPKKLTVSDN
ncbi:MAG: 50S ribosomal protein L28 [Candidatus Omnitrophica bacterium]|nr:50S ribosomal protein L28 [Candidatus Omnitrophota bacterium]MBU0896916.1 50S ribosomal protein L28 [Candidatus Omnitrophota bacterium]MBU1366362.1 50S ribosomal protein L28 [Candidatus Omnitrophota bacterium]MBU1523053.1 50S ribosomal protein L28 [Candidatus Omnitrophota bacterium]MBU1810440.1 50S ribosomal protein L28 [Candidatus Omnitrophota bacterium]